LNEKINFVVRQLHEDHSKEIHQLEVELAGVQESLESKHVGVVEAKNAENLARTEILSLKDRVAELESELARLRLENEELRGANSSLKHATEAESAKLSQHMQQIESERAELMQKQQAAETYGGESGIEEDGMVEVIIGWLTVWVTTEYSRFKRIGQLTLVLFPSKNPQVAYIF
jgi:chromosome segregation ATPase